MKTTTFLIGSLMSYTGMALALPAAAPMEVVSTSPFHDCLEAGGDFNTCRSAGHLAGRSDQDSNISKRAAPSTFFDAITDLGQSVAGGEKCYSVNKLGGTGWLTNTAVSALKTEACTAAVQQAIKAGTGLFKTTQSGFYQANAGPVVSPKVKFYLSVLMGSAQLAGIPNLDVNQLGIDLCTKGIDHLTGDKGCTAKRKVGVITSHTSVNGGEFDWGLNGAKPTYDNGGICENCLMTLIMEASNMYDPDGNTAIPSDG